jgi:hypothetical protein
VYWLNPEIPETFPRGLLDALEDDAYALAPLAVRKRALDDIQARTKLDMQADSLQPLQPLDVTDDADDRLPTQVPKLKPEDEFDGKTVTRASEFLRQSVRFRTSPSRNVGQVLIGPICRPRNA